MMMDRFDRFDRFYRDEMRMYVPKLKPANKHEKYSNPFIATTQQKKFKKR